VSYSEFIQSILDDPDYSINNQVLLYHHIIPISQGGQDGINNNFIYLNPHDYWIAYQYLVDLYPEDEKIVKRFNELGTSEGFIEKKNQEYYETYIWLPDQYEKKADQFLQMINREVQ
jgi:predicted nucleotide-binding protein (sugar kinase/HSP70/actin superfamily)